MTVSHELIAAQLSLVQTSVSEVKDRLKNMEERQAALMDNGAEFRVMAARLDEILKAYGRTQEVHTKAIETLLKEQEEMKKQLAVQDAEKKTVMGLLNSKFVGWLVAAASGIFMFLKEVI